MDIQLYLVNAGEDEFTTLAVLRQQFGLSFAEARDLVMELPSALPPIAAASVDALQAALAAVGAEISTSMPQPVQEAEPTQQFNVNDMLDIFSDTFADKSFGATEDHTPENSSGDDEEDSDSNEEDYDEEDYDDEEEEENDVIFTLNSCGNQKLRIVKMINEKLECGLKEAKEICDGAPIDVTVDGSYLNEVIDLVDDINDAGGEADWDYADSDSEDDDDEDDEEYEYDERDSLSGKALLLTSCGSSKLQVVKLLKEFFEIDLVTAKTYADSTPITIPLTHRQADELKDFMERLEEAGARCYGTTT